MRNKFTIKTKDLLVANGQVVMSESERPFLELLFSRLAHLRPATVLEVGFGLGVSARLIQRYLRPKFHDVVEIDRTIYRDLRDYAQGRRGISAILGDFWSFRAPRCYDFIFYDPFDYYDGDPTADVDEDYDREKASRMAKLLEADGTVCCPSFGKDTPEPMPGFRRSFYEVCKVPPYLLDIGTVTTTGAIVCWQQKKTPCPSRKPHPHVDH